MKSGLVARKKGSGKIQLGISTLLVLLILGNQNVLAEINQEKSVFETRDVERAILLAKAAQKRAAAVEGEWRDVRRMIKKARKAMRAGKLELAMEMANKAKKHGELGYAQAMRQKDLKMPAYLQEEEFGNYWSR